MCDDFSSAVPKLQPVATLSIACGYWCFEIGLTERGKGVARGPVQAEGCCFHVFSLLASTAATRLRHLLPLDPEIFSRCFGRVTEVYLKLCGYVAAVKDQVLGANAP